MILVDTSVWVDHLRDEVPGLTTMLERNEVLMHPFVRGEIACGHLRNRAEVLSLMAALPAAPRATDAEATDMIQQRDLMGRGIGHIDVHLLASVMLAHDARLWTRDKRLAHIAQELGLALSSRT